MIKKIYIADEDPRFIELIADFLGNIGFKVDGSHELFDLILLDSENLPDIFLLNIQLWNEDNNKIICQFLKWNEPTKSIPIILFSKSRGPEESIKVTYADNFVYMSFEINNLQGLLDKVAEQFKR